MNSVKTDNFRKSDILLLCAFLAAGLLFAAFLLFTSKGGAMVEVSVSGNVIGTYSLSVDTQVEIEGVDQGRNYLTIQDGYAFLTDATCPDKLCVHMGRISKDRQSIICLPNEVVIRILDDAESDLDFVTGGNH